MAQVTETSSDNKARYWAKKAGWRAVKSRWRKNSIDNKGGFQLIDGYYNNVVDGIRFDMSADRVVELVRDELKRY